MPAPPPAPMLKLPGATVAVPAGTKPEAPGAAAAAVATDTRVPLPKPEPSPPASAKPVTAGAPAKPAPTSGPALTVEGAVVAEPAAAAQTPAAPAASTPVPRTGGSGGGDNAWLNSQPPANFTVQVMGVSAASAAQNYLRRHPNVGLRIIRTVRDGRDWYVVVKGSFAGRGEAQGAVKDLQDANAQPWVRTIDGIQRDTRGP